MVQGRVVRRERGGIEASLASAPSLDPGEVREQRAGAGEVVVAGLGDGQGPLQEPARTARVHQEPRGGAESCPHSIRALPESLQTHAGGACLARREGGSVHVLRAQTGRLVDEKGVEVRPVPVRVGHLVARTGGHQQLVGPVAATLPGPARLVMKIAEPPLEPAGDLRVGRLPGSPLGQCPEAWQIVAVAERLEPQVRQRRGRLPDGEARVVPPLDEQHRPAEAPGDLGQQRPGESAAHDGEVEVGRHTRHGTDRPQSVNLFPTTPVSTLRGLRVRCRPSCSTTPRRGRPARSRPGK